VKLSTAGFCRHGNRIDLVCPWAQPGCTRQQVHHAAGLTRRAAHNVEEGQQFLGRAALKALCNVVADAQRATVQWILFSTPKPVTHCFKKDITQFRQPNGLLPHRKIFKPSICHDSF
jgi:hypothetical protein